MASIRRRNGKYQVQIRVGSYSRSQSFHKLNDAKSWARKEEELAEQRRYLGSKYEPCNLAEILVRYLRDVTPHKRSRDTERIVLQKLLKEAWVNVMKRSATVCFTVAVFQLMNDIAASSSTEMELVSEAFMRSTNQLPDSSINADIAEYLSQYSDAQLKGVLANVKGIYHELIFTHAENYDEDSITAAIFEETNHPGADVEFMVDGEVIGQVQLKAVMDKSLVLEHFEKYPDIDVYATSEVASQLLDVKDSGFSNRELHEDVAGFVAEIGVDDTIEKAGSGFVLGASMSAAISLADAIKNGKISRHAVRRAVKDGSLSAAVAAAVDFILS